MEPRAGVRHGRWCAPARCGVVSDNEILFGQARHQGAGIGSGLLPVIQVVGQAAFADSGRACASTLVRNLGVSQKTENKAR